VEVEISSIESCGRYVKTKQGFWYDTRNPALFKVKNPDV
jgi:hypothetical protein